MKKLLCLLVLVTFSLIFYVNNKDKETIVIYTAMEQFRNDELSEQLNERFPSSNILVKYVSTGKLAAKILVEGRNSEADILVAVDTAYLEKVKDNLATINENNYIYLDGLTIKENSNKYLTWERYGGAFIINTELFQKYGLEKPKSYNDLLDPQYKGLIAMPNPKTSGTGYLFYKSLVNKYGLQETLDYFNELNKNIKQYTESGSTPLKLLSQNEIALAITLTYSAVSDINKGYPYEIIFPDIGSPYSLSGTAMIKGRERDKEIVNIFEYIVNDFFYYDKQFFSPEKIIENQENLVNGYPLNIEYSDMTGINDIVEKERLLDLWMY